MSRSFQAKSEDVTAAPRLRLMRDRLDELDALLDKMLALPLPTPEEPPPLRLHEPEATGEPESTIQAESPQPAARELPEVPPAEDDSSENFPLLAPAKDASPPTTHQTDDGQEKAPTSAPEPATLRLTADFDADLAATEARLKAAAPPSLSLQPVTTPSLSRTMMVLEQPLRSPSSQSPPVDDPPPTWWLNLLGWAGLLLLLAAAGLLLGRWLAQP